jgi:DNA-binding NtrC family response regulator
VAGGVHAGFHPPGYDPAACPACRELAPHEIGAARRLSLREAVTEFKRGLVASVLAEHGGNRTRAARALKIERTYLQRLVREFKALDT